MKLPTCLAAALLTLTLFPDASALENKDIDASIAELRQTAETLLAGEAGLMVRTAAKGDPQEDDWSEPRALSRERSLEFVYHQLAGLEYQKALDTGRLPDGEHQKALTSLEDAIRSEKTLFDDAEAVSIDPAQLESASWWGLASAYADRLQMRRYEFRTPTVSPAVRGGRKLDKSLDENISKLDDRAVSVSRDIDSAADPEEKARLLLESARIYERMASAAASAAKPAAKAEGSPTSKEPEREVAALELEDPAPPIVELTPREIYQRAGPAVVLIICRGAGRDGELGTGSVIDERGHVLTNAHVVISDSTGRPFKDIRVYFKPAKLTGDPKKDLSDPVTARVVKSDRDLDLALLELSKIPSLKAALPIDDADDVQPGDPVVAIGHPEQGGLWTLTSGVVSTVVADHGGVPGKHVFQTDASINRGNSGGPLINLRGSMIGVNTSMARRAADGIAITAVNFSLKSSVVKTWLSDARVDIPEAPAETPPQPAAKPMPMPAPGSRPAARPASPAESEPRMLTPARPYKRDMLIEGMTEMEDMMEDMRRMLDRRRRRPRR
ncbi:MAG: serine protease [Elusimicrobiota bacterium]